MVITIKCEVRSKNRYKVTQQMFIEGVKNSDFLTILDKKSFNN